MNVADFGGALGSSWWQHRAWLPGIEIERWSVIEQPALIEAGRREFTIGPLRFYGSLAECWANERPTVILCSAVLPYLEKPHELLAEMAAQPFRHVIIDRTGFVFHGRDRLAVQQVPPSIYEASYPCWFFNRERLLQDFGTDWTLVDEWTVEDGSDIAADHRGMRLERQP